MGKIEKSMKRWLKKKIKLTMSVIVTFLITGVITYSESLEITYDKNSGVLINGEKNEDITVDKNNNYLWTNNKNINKDVDIKKDISDIDFSIINNGSILTKSLKGATGPFPEEYGIEYVYNGMVVGSNIKNLDNNGLILSDTEDILTGVKGNGLIIANEFNQIKNTGIIASVGNINNNLEVLSGADFVLNGNGILKLNFGEGIQDIINNGYILGKYNVSEKILIKGQEFGEKGRGIFGFNIPKLENTGIIDGKVIMKADIEESQFPMTLGIGVNSNTITNLNNSGIIRGTYNGIITYKDEGTIKNVGNGIDFLGVEEETYINNKGQIIGETNVNLDKIKNSGNGLYIDDMPGNSINEINNKGSFIGSANKSIETSNGNGIFINKRKISNFINLGIISGINSGLTIIPEKSVNNYVEKGGNYGLIIGKTPVNIKDEKIKNNGYLIKLSDNKAVDKVIEEGSKENKVLINIFGKEENYSILNTTISNDEKDAWQEFGNKEDSKNLENYIINGAGVGSGTVTVAEGKEFSLTNGIVNAYKTAVTMGKDSHFTGTNVIINSGDLGKLNDNGTPENLNDDILEYSPVIVGTNSKNTLTLAGNVQLNGSIDLLGAGDSDTFNFGKAGAGAQANIYDEIKNAENINVTNGSNITLYETAKVSGTDKLNIEAGSQIILRVDSSVKADDGTYKTHALYNAPVNKTLFISGDTSKLDMNSEYGASEDKASPEDYKKLSVLNVKTSGLGKDSIIAFGNVKFVTNDRINTEIKPEYTQNNTTVWVKTDSILHGAKVNETKLDNGKYDTNIKIEAQPDLFSIADKITPPVDPDKPINPDKPVEPDKPVNPKPDKPNGSDKYENLYVKLNEVYKGIYSSNDRNFNALNDIVTNYTFGDKDKSDYPVVGNEKMQMATLLGYLRSVYSETPYSFSNESTRKSMGLFHDTVRDNNFKAKEDEWLIYGGLVHQSGDQEQTYYGRSYHGFDTGTADTDAEIKLTGAYGQFEYGNTDTLSTGIMVGGTKSDVEASFF